MCVIYARPSVNAHHICVATCTGTHVVVQSVLCEIIRVGGQIALADADGKLWNRTRAHQPVR